ncbi:sensor domain-containing diguanylate cyclase [Vibrio sp. VB16]|uniref:sensor domain-containing diguanylate cyclase n=1 Tax=Vibrio sp. VB16 TaxID=2785746 RepID=UPI00189FD615|nr:diguanylate cyclase [Vibrio sp. VB16]UGA55220.1 diguanylate cyclase [Vibrio sp. VB16]
MDNLFYQIAKWNYFAEIEVLVVVIAFSIIVMQRRKYQNQITSYYKNAPIAIMVIDRESGIISLSNRSAMQQLGIRKIGEKYLYPSGLEEASFLKTFKPISGKRFQNLEQTWTTSDRPPIHIDFSGQKIRFNNRSSWLLYATLHQNSGLENEQVKTSLRIARTSLDTLSELIYIKNKDGHIVDTNHAFDKFWKGRVDESDVDIEGILQGRSTQRRWTTDPEGRGCLLETSQSTLLSSDGEVLGSLGISHDVTDWFKMQQDLRDEMEKRKGTEIALAQRDTILESLLESSPDGIALFNENKVYEACNQAFADMLGIADYTTLVGKRIEEVLLQKMDKDISRTDEQVLKDGKPLRYREQTFDENGHPRWFDVVKSPYKDPNSGANGVLLMTRDVTDSCLVEMQLEEMNHELERLSFLDGLTQIANRRSFDEQLDTILNIHKRQKMSLTVMLCDIDFFKDFNDNYGHQKGDETLRLVAQSFQQVLTRSSDCVARYGGEEFGFVIPNTNYNGAQVLARKIHDVIKELNIKHEFSSVSDRITLSIGVVSVTPTSNDVPNRLIGYADQALYSAKKQGRNQTRYHQN